MPITGEKLDHLWLTSSGVLRKKKPFIEHTISADARVSMESLTAPKRLVILLNTRLKEI